MKSTRDDQDPGREGECSCLGTHLGTRGTRKKVRVFFPCPLPCSIGQEIDVYRTPATMRSGAGHAERPYTGFNTSDSCSRVATFSLDPSGSPSLELGCSTLLNRPLRLQILNERTTNRPANQALVQKFRCANNVTGSRPTSIQALLPF